jgi:N-acetylglucosamine kinase-like BadF-type ATPase
VKTAVVLAADGGNSKTDLVVASLEGEALAYVRGPGSNSHAVGAEGCAAILGALIARTGVALPARHGAFYLCGADLPEDLEALRAAVTRQAWVDTATVDNDTFALLHTGTDAPDGVAVVCGSGINCVGRSGEGRVARYPGLGWETGDWGGSEDLAREAIFHAARAEDGRGEPTVLVDAVREHFGVPSVAAAGAAVHYRRTRPGRVGELAPAVIAAAEAGDSVAGRLVARLADEVTLLAVRALGDLGLADRRADVVLGGGMFRDAAGFLVREVVARLGRDAPSAVPVVCAEPPVLGAALAALDGAGASARARERLRAAFREPPTPEAVDAA